LLDGQKRADFLAVRADNADGCGDQKRPELSGDSNASAAQHHQQGADNQHPLAADAIRARGEPKRNGRVTGQRQREQKPDFGLRQSDIFQV
jgi:hypothetical protein